MQGDPSWPSLATLASAVFILCWLLFFSWGRLGTSFADDDYANMAIYFERGPWRMLISQVLLWQDTSRPMAAAYYLPLHHWFGLDPVPFQAAMMALIAANTALVYLLARYLGCGKLASGLAALAACYHPGLASLHYNIDNIYDILCFLFSLGVLTCYVGIRRKGRLLDVPETFAALALYLCALNSKEMAVVLPVLLLAYEWLFRPAYGDRTGIGAWLLGPARIAIMQGALNLAYIFGKMFSPDALGTHAGYRPVFSWDRVLAFQKGSLEQLLCWPGEMGLAAIFAFWAALTLLGWNRKSPVLRFCWISFLLAPLPIEFLEHRLQGCLYIPMAFLAIFAAAVLVDGATALGAPLPLPARSVVFAALVGFAVLLWARETSFRNEAYVRPAGAQQGLRAREIVRQMDSLHPRVQPHSRVVFLNDPFGGYDMAFIARLWFADRTIAIQLQDKLHMPESEVAGAHALFTFRDGRLAQLK